MARQSLPSLAQSHGIKCSPNLMVPWTAASSLYGQAPKRASDLIYWTLS